MSEVLHSTDPADGANWTPEMHREFDKLESGVMATGSARETVLKNSGLMSNPPDGSAKPTPVHPQKPSVAGERPAPASNTADDPPEHVLAEQRIPRDFTPISETVEDTVAREQATRDFLPPAA